MRKPRIELSGYEGNLGEDMLDKYIREQNFINEHNELKIINKKKMKKSKSQTIF